MQAKTSRIEKAEGRIPRWVRRLAAYVTGALVLFVAFGGFLHTKAGRPLMVRMFGARCPMSNATAETVDNARKMGVGATRGDVPAPLRPALGFVLDATTRDQVHAWSRARHVECRDEHPWLIQCDAVDPVALGRPSSDGLIEELSLAFRPDGRLSNVTTLRRHLSPDDGARIVEGVGTRLYGELGRPLPNGHIAEGDLSNSPLSSLRISLRYSDYLAEVTAMNLPTTGVAVREQYVSAND